MYIHDGIDELTLQVTHFLDSVEMCKTIHTLVFCCIWLLLGPVCPPPPPPPRLIANRLRSAPVRGQSELLVIVDDLIF